MTSPTDAPFSSLGLDGSSVHAAWSQLYTRCASILRRAADAKQAGVGCFARPEADVALLQLPATMHAIDPEAGWLDAGMITYLYSLDDALRRADEVWWGHDWLDPSRESPHGAFAGYGPASLLKTPADPSVGTSTIVRLLTGIQDFAPPPRPARAMVSRRRALYDAIVQRVSAVRSLVPRPDRSFPPARPVNLPPVDASLGTQLWLNAQFPAWPEKPVTKRRQLGDALARGLATSLSVAPRAREQLPRLLGMQLLPEAYNDRHYPQPRLKYWLDSGPFGNAQGLIDAAILDRIMGGPPDDLLAACLGFSRCVARETTWSIPYAPRWLHIQDWDAALIGAGVGDDASLAVWRQHAPDRTASPPGTRACNRALAEWTAARRWPADLKTPKSLDRFEFGFLRAMRGLCGKDTAETAQGVRDLLGAFGRIDYRMARGQTYPRLCLQAVAVQRMAMRSGLVLDIPPDAPNDPDLVTAADPTVAALPWVPLPGIDLVSNADEPLAWPSLYLNAPVRTVNDPPIE